MPVVWLDPALDGDARAALVDEQELRAACRDALNASSLSTSFLSKYLTKRGLPLAAGDEVTVLRARTFRVFAVEGAAAADRAAPGGAAIEVKFAPPLPPLPAPHLQRLFLGDAWVRDRAAEVCERYPGSERPASALLRALHGWLLAQACSALLARRALRAALGAAPCADVAAAPAWEASLLPLARASAAVAPGISPARGALVTGAPGVGKSALCAAVWSACRLRGQRVRCPVLFRGELGQSEAALRRVFDAAASAAPSLLILDDIDAVAALPARRGASQGASAAATLRGGLARSLSAELDRCAGGAFVVGCTALGPRALDGALLSPPRLGVHVHVAPPDEACRRRILRGLLSRLLLPPGALGALVDAAAPRSQGYTPADLERLAGDLVGRGAPEDLLRQLRSALHSSPPALLRATSAVAPEALAPNPGPLPLSWPPAGACYLPLEGCGAQVAEAAAAVLLPLLRPDAARRMGVSPSGLLLTGPPGTGKTALARAIGAEALARRGVRFLSAAAPDLIHAAVGASEAALSNLFAAARSAAPSLLFVDQLEAVARRRAAGGADADGGVAARVVALMAMEMDAAAAAAEHVIVVGATNLPPEMIDGALRRPGRLSCRVHLEPPPRSALADVFERKLGGRPLALPMRLPRECATRRSVAQWAAERCPEGTTGADVEGMVRDWGLSALRRALRGGGDGAGPAAAIAGEDVLAVMDAFAGRGGEGTAAERRRGA